MPYVNSNNSLDTLVLYNTMPKYIYHLRLEFPLDFTNEPAISHVHISEYQSLGNIEFFTGSDT
jgi:hypothetical protein